MTYKQNNKIKIWLLIFIIILILLRYFQLLPNAQTQQNFSQSKSSLTKFSQILIKSEKKANRLSQLEYPISEPSLKFSDLGQENKEKQTISFSRQRQTSVSLCENIKRLINSFKPVIEFIRLSGIYLISHIHLLLSRVRIFSLKSLEKTLFARDFTLVKALVFGDTSSINQDLYHSFKVIGILHVLSASAANLAILQEVFKPVFMLFGKRSSLSTSTYLQLVIIVGYTLLVGQVISLWRAAIMTILGLLGTRVFLRKVSLLYLLVCTAIFILIINPFYIEDLGFQLSFLATLGILTLLPIFEKWSGVVLYRWPRLCLFVAAQLLLSSAAQFFIFPLLATNFSEMNFLSFVSNVILLPFFDFFLLLAFLLVVGSVILGWVNLWFFFHNLQLLLAYMINKYIDIIIFLMKKIEKMSFLNLQVGTNILLINEIFLMIYSFTFFLAIFKFYKNHKKLNYRLIA